MFSAQRLGPANPCLPLLENSKAFFAFGILDGGLISFFYGAHRPRDC